MLSNFYAAKCIIPRELTSQIECLNAPVELFDQIFRVTNNIALDAPGPTYTLIGHEQSSMVISLHWDGDKRLASGGADGRKLIWSLETGKKECFTRNQ